MARDERLIERAGAGDERAFAELVERHRDPLLRYVSRRFSPELAEDAVQEALLAAHRALRSGTRPTDVRAWLSTIAWRRALDLTRRERDAVPLDAEVAAAAAHEPEAKVLRANELGRIVAAFSELPERQRAALRLSALEGRSLEEIGDALDVAPDTAKSLVARSRRTLTHRLAAAELGCDAVRLQMEDSAARGVRLAGDVTLHLRECRSCARAHREIRRRRRLRVALVIPFGLAIRTIHLRDRLRDLIAFNPAWEAQMSAAKLCTAACLTAVSAGTVAAPAVIVIPRHTPTALTTTSLAKPKHAKKKPPRKVHRVKATPTATVYAAATPTWTPTPVPTQVKATRKKSVFPRMAVAGGGAEMRPKRTPTPISTPSPTPTPVVTPTPTG
ncbi:RNA polymerase sigma factor [Solirubrobacter ginsenosidimutans]|uniref:RNA polymerase sigma factor n=1 Tax=Solirubrobacter ginsenosidimutans TaxID=490573 RepID=A0A9X3MX56_9ACTN|nr:RNA polymerase sigma factor [Solirubrobacter ginsenosidimutans]MDA0163226.1 RNA polymerase sigma factor [Solirubrobacter ginsenosidimutans]